LFRNPSAAVAAIHTSAADTRVQFVASRFG